MPTKLKIDQNGQAFRVARMSDTSDSSWDTLREGKFQFFHLSPTSPKVKCYQKKTGKERKVRRTLDFGSDLELDNVKSE